MKIILSRKLALSLLACWLLIFLSLSKGVKSLGKVSYITAIFPYIMIIALIIRGVTLKGAMKGGVCYRHRAKSIITLTNPVLQSNAIPPSVLPTRKNLICGFGGQVK